jgi:hypothetical protein
MYTSEHNIFIVVYSEEWNVSKKTRGTTLLVSCLPFRLNSCHLVYRDCRAKEAPTTIRKLKKMRKGLDIFFSIIVLAQMPQNWYQMYEVEIQSNKQTKGDSLQILQITPCLQRDSGMVP